MRHWHYYREISRTEERVDMRCGCGATYSHHPKFKPQPEEEMRSVTEIIDRLTMTEDDWIQLPNEMRFALADGLADDGCDSHNERTKIEREEE